MKNGKQQAPIKLVTVLVMTVNFRVKTMIGYQETSIKRVWY